MVEVKIKDPLMQNYVTLIRGNLSMFRSHETAHIPQELNTREYNLTKLASARASCVNHLFIHKTLGNPTLKI